MVRPRSSLHTRRLHMWPTRCFVVLKKVGPIWMTRQLLRPFVSSMACLESQLGPVPALALTAEWAAPVAQALLRRVSINGKAWRTAVRVELAALMDPYPARTSLKSIQPRSGLALAWGSVLQTLPWILK